MSLEMLFATDSDRVKKMLSRVLKANSKQKDHVEYGIFEKGYHRKPVFVSLPYFHSRENPYVLRIQILEDGYKVKYFQSDNPYLLVIKPLFNSLHNYGLILLKERLREIGKGLPLGDSPIQGPLLKDDVEDYTDIKEDICMDFGLCTYKLFPD